MIQEISSKVVGQLVQAKYTDLWESKKIPIPFFDNQEFAVTFNLAQEDNINIFMDEADLALTCFLKLNTEDRDSISDRVYKNCMDFLDGVVFEESDELLRQIRDKNDIWNYIYPGGVIIERRHCNDRDIYVSVGCRCSWDQEYGHGLHFVFRQGKKITRISDFDSGMHLTDADAFDIPDEEDELLSAFHCD